VVSVKKTPLNKIMARKRGADDMNTAPPAEQAGPLDADMGDDPAGPASDSEADADAAAAAPRSGKVTRPEFSALTPGELAVRFFVFRFLALCFCSHRCVF
jgi:hypothetical protein